MKKIRNIILFIVLTLFIIVLGEFLYMKKGNKPFLLIKKEIRENIITYNGIFFKLYQCTEDKNKYTVKNYFEKLDSNFCKPKSKFKFIDGIYKNKNIVPMTEKEVELLSQIYSEEEIDNMTKQEFDQKIEYIEHQTILKDKKRDTFNEAEQKIIDVIYDNTNIYNNFDKKDLELFEIVELKSIGYYESTSNIRYIEIDYISKCYSGTYDCDQLETNKRTSIELGIPFNFLIKIDMNTYEIIEKMDGISIPFNSDWKATDTKIE